MAETYGAFAQYHQATDVATVLGAQYQPAATVGQWPPNWRWGYWTYNYDFKNFFHPYVGALIKQLNQTNVQGMLASSFLTTLVDPYSTAADGYILNPTNDASLTVTLEPRDINTIVGGPYSGYN